MAIDLSDTATRLMREMATSEVGGYYKLRRTTGLIKDPDTGLVTGGATEEIPIAGGVLIGYDQSEIDGTRIMGGDHKLTVAPNIGPLVTDVLLVGGSVEKTIVSANPVTVDGVVQVYHLQVRSR